MQTAEPNPTLQISRLKVAIRGAVQGVGFRPFIYRLATGMGLPGWVNNSSQGVFIEVEGERPALEEFLLRIERDRPPRSFIQSMEPSYLDPVGFTSFEIRESDPGGEKVALILPDIATCPDCLNDISDPSNRRYLYPFTNCTNCGPRFTIIEALPYDRPNTTMRRFAMCEQCRSEYENPLDRRFHAQPNACPVCGPHLELWMPDGTVAATHHEALLMAADAIRQGQVVAVKGLGGFHLMVDPGNEEAVKRLRLRKHREEKPLAVMAPSLDWAREQCEVSATEERLLTSPESPIVLLRRMEGVPGIAPGVAPGNPYLGVMLPYTPLHHILLEELGFAVVATSGNLSDEPICTDEHDALTRLGGIADLFLVHDRPIARHVDDSIVRMMAGRELVTRRARGYAPLPIRLQSAELGMRNGDGGRTETAPSASEGSESTALSTPHSALAVGAHLKNAVALAVGHDVFVSQHIGDLETVQATEAFQRVIADFERLYEVKPQAVVCDCHPEYISTRQAEEMGLPLYRVQHHVAHVFSCMAENELEGPVLGVSWDGTGYGLDGTVWGGEFFTVGTEGVERAAHFRTFALPGGETAIKEPRRTAVGLLYEMLGPQLLQEQYEPVKACTPQELRTWLAMIDKRLNAPRTSSAGRLFDAVASLTGLRQRMSFEGQAAMELEFALAGVQTVEYYPFDPGEASGPSIVDWEPTIRGVLADVGRGASIPEVSAKFHNTLAEVIVAIARKVGVGRVVLTGGCFQNKYLTERAIERLRAEGFRPYWHQRIPANDGGIALGQVNAVRNAERGMRSPFVIAEAAPPDAR